MRCASVRIVLGITKGCEDNSPVLLVHGNPPGLGHSLLQQGR